MPNFGQFGNATPDTEKEKAMVVTGFSSFTDDDFKDKGGLFDPIPKGRYHFVVYDCQTGFTKKDNTLMKTILMDIHHEDGTKTRLTDYLVYKSNQKWKFAYFFDAIGLGDALKENGIGGADDPLWTTAVGQEGDFEVDNETSEWNGKQTTRNVIKKYYKPER